jgi:hypothetical protein
MNFEQFVQQECPVMLPRVTDIETLDQAFGGDPEWSKVKKSVPVLAIYREALRETGERQQGLVPEDYTAVCECAKCGFVFLQDGMPLKVEGCPWCLNRVDGLPIPRPEGYPWDCYGGDAVEQRGFAC